MPESLRSLWRFRYPPIVGTYADDQFGKGSWPRNRIRLAYDVVVAADPYIDDRDNSSPGIGNWGLMGGGSWGGDGRSPETPVHLCAWSKARLGWVVPTVITHNLSRHTIQRVEDHPEVYKLWTEGTVGHQYFLIENRGTVGFDAKLPSGGLLIWHIDNAVTTQNDNERHKLVDLEAADGNEDMDRGPNRGDVAAIGVMERSRRDEGRHRERVAQRAGVRSERRRPGTVDRYRLLSGTTLTEEESG
ncbi:MAG: hypothetical protein ACE5OR_16710 [bacterium]